MWLFDPEAEVVEDDRKPVEVTEKIQHNREHVSKLDQVAKMTDGGLVKLHKVTKDEAKEVNALHKLQMPLRYLAKLEAVFGHRTGGWPVLLPVFSAGLIEGLAKFVIGLDNVETSYEQRQM